MELGQVVFGNLAHYFQILNFNYNKGDLEIQILLDGITRTLIKHQNECWSLKKTDETVQQELIQVIGDALGRMFRI